MIGLGLLCLVPQPIRAVLRLSGLPIDLENSAGSTERPSKCMSGTAIPTLRRHCPNKVRQAAQQQGEERHVTLGQGRVTECQTCNLGGGLLGEMVCELRLKEKWNFRSGGRTVLGKVTKKM